MIPNRVTAFSSTDEAGALGSGEGVVAALSVMVMISPKRVR
jgi:hypothetical protein